MKKWFVWILLLSIAALTTAATNTTAAKAPVLKEINKPFQMILEGDRMYVVQKEVIYIYALNDYHLITQFGKSGEGPKEFRLSPAVNEGNVWIYVTPDLITVNSMGRLSFFNKKGEYLREAIAPPGLFQPMGKGFMAINFGQDEKELLYILNLYDEKLTKLNEVCRQRQAFQQQGDINPFEMVGPLNYVFKDNIYVKGKDGIIDVYDFNGQKCRQITYDYPKLAVSDSTKERIFDYYKTNPATKQYYDYIKPRIAFPEKLPVIRWYTVADDKVYVLTYKMEKGNGEFYIFDTKGKFLKKVMVPLAERDAILVYPYDIQKGIFYQLRENSETENIEVYKQTL